MSNEPFGTSPNSVFADTRGSGTEAPAPWRFALLWMLHQAIAFAGGLTILFLSANSPVGNAPVWVQVAVMFLGQLVLGYTMPRSPSNVRAASLVWFLPTLAFLGVFLWNWYDFGFASTAADYFAVHGIGDNSKMATVVFTVPTGWAVVYSLGAAAKK